MAFLEQQCHQAAVFEHRAFLESAEEDLREKEGFGELQRIHLNWPPNTHKARAEGTGNSVLRPGLPTREHSVPGHQGCGLGGSHVQEQGAEVPLKRSQVR